MPLFGNDTLSVDKLLDEGSALGLASNYEGALAKFDSARTMASSLEDTLAWLQSIDSLILYENRAHGSRKNLNVQVTSSDSGIVISGEGPLERVRLWRETRDSLRAYWGKDLSQDLVDSTALFHVAHSSFSPQIFFLPDSLSSWPWDSVQKYPGRFELVKNPHIDSMGAWVKLRLRNSSDQMIRAYLQFGTEDDADGTWEKIEAWWKPEGQSWQLSVTGWDPEMQGKELPYVGTMMPLIVPPRSDQWLYLKVGPSLGQTSNPKFMVRQIDLTTWLKAERAVTGNRALFLGILIIQAVYFLLLFVVTRDKSYAAYVLFISGLIGVTLTFGYISDWVPKANLWQVGVGFFSGMACYYGLVLFSYHFLKTADQVPLKRKWLRRLLWAMPVTIGIPILVVLLLRLVNLIENFQFVIGIIFLIAILVVMVLFMISLVLGVVMSWRSLKRGYSPARFFLLAQGLLLLGVLAPVGMTIASSFIENQPDWLSLRWLVNSLEIGIILQLSFMAMSVGQKRRLLEGEKLEAEQALNQELSRLNQAFSRFVPMEFLKAIGKSSVLEVGVGDSAEKEVAVLFSDIRGYTTLSEQMSPVETFQFINDYLGEVAPEIRRKGGFVNQFLGDGIMALFIENPTAALESALAMQEALARFNSRRKVPIRVGIGLHSGPLMMGIIGNEDRLDAGVVADAVNTAARMEGLTKYFGSSLLVSETIVALLPEDYPASFRYVGQVIVKGRRQPLPIYDFFEADPPEIRELKQETFELFTSGLKAYLDKDFENAIRLFGEVLTVHPLDLAAQRYVEKARIFEQEGVPSDWSGVEVMLDK